MLQSVKEWDEQLFLFLNDLNTPYLDPVFWFITNHLTWIPFYLVLAGLIVKNFKKESIVILVAISILIVITDQFTSGFMKPFFGRLRPCHEPGISEVVHLIDGWCGGRFGFVSGHSANSFSLATFIFLTFRNIYKYAGLMFIWAAMVAYSRVYVGVHYPGDILGGAVIGMLIAFLMYRLLLWYLEKKQPQTLKKIQPLH